MPTEGQIDELQVMQDALTVLQIAIGELKDNSLREVKDEMVNQVLECGALITKISEVDKLSNVKIVGSEEQVEDVRNAIATLQQAVKVAMLELMGEKVFTLLTYLKQKIDLLCFQVKGYCKQAIEHYVPIFELLHTMQSDRSAGAITEEPKKEARPLDEWTEEEIAEAQEIFEALRMRLEEARREAVSEEDREEMHALFESLRLGKEFSDRARKQNELNEEIMAALRKVAEANERMTKTLHKMHLSEWIHP